MRRNYDEEIEYPKSELWRRIIIEEEELRQRMEKEQRRRTLLRIVIFGSIALIGVIGISMYAVFGSASLFNLTKREFDIKTEEIYVLSYRQMELEDRLERVESLIRNIDTDASNIESELQYNEIVGEMGVLADDIEHVKKENQELKDILDADPITVLSVALLKKDFEDTEDKLETRVSTLDKKVDRNETSSHWIFGILIAVVLALFASTLGVDILHRMRLQSLPVGLEDRYKREKNENDVENEEDEP